MVDISTLALRSSERLTKDDAGAEGAEASRRRPKAGGHSRNRLPQRHGSRTTVYLATKAINTTARDLKHTEHLKTYSADCCSAHFCAWRLLIVNQAPRTPRPIGQTENGAIHEGKIHCIGASHRRKNQEITLTGSLPWPI